MMQPGCIGAVGRVGLRAAGLEPNPLALATWLLFNNGVLSPLVQSGATSMGWLFDSTGTLRARPHNLIPNSEVINAAGLGVTVDSNVIAGPNGQVTADWVREDASNGEHYAQDDNIVVTAGVTYTWSFFARGDGSGRRAYVRTALQGTAGAIFDLSNGVGSPVSGTALVAFGSEDSGGGWRRCWIRFTATGTGTAVFRVQVTSGQTTVYQGSPGAGMYVVGKQLNVGELQPYYPTTGAAYYGPRVSYDPAALSLGPFLLAEEARTNSIRNNTMQGAVAGAVGAGGSLPTNYVIQNTAGLSATVALGSAAGMPVLDLRVQGTTNNTAWTLSFEALTQIASALGVTWTQSLFWQIIGGTFTNVTGFFVDIRELDSGGSQVVSGAVAVSAPTPTLARVVSTRTTTASNVAFVQSRLRFVVTSGAEVNFTLRIGLPQLEQVPGAAVTASSPILTFGSAVTRSADNLSVTNLAATGVNASEGTIYSDSVSDAFTQRILALTDGTANNSYQQYINSNVVGFDGYVAGAFQGNGGISGTFTTGARYRVASAFRTNDVVTAANGALGVRDTSYALPAVDRLLLGQARTGGSTVATRIYQAAIIPQRVSDSGLQRMTRI